MSDDDRLLCHPEEKDLFEAINGLRQFDAVRKRFRESPKNLGLTPAIVCELNRIAIEGIFECAGQYRTGSVSITNSIHETPDCNDVPRLVEEMCAYANSKQAEPLHCSAYLMWRLNWIHPFEDGNGRTSRAISYLALCTGFHIDIPGTLTIPDQISRCRTPYYNALDSADAAWREGILDLTEMERLINKMLIKQLETAV